MFDVKFMFCNHPNSADYFSLYIHLIDNNLYFDLSVTYRLIKIFQISLI